MDEGVVFAPPWDESALGIFAKARKLKARCTFVVSEVDPAPATGDVEGPPEGAPTWDSKADMLALLYGLQGACLGIRQGEGAREYPIPSGSESCSGTSADARFACIEALSVSPLLVPFAGDSCIHEDTRRDA
jgi:hypothetical protein